jgi:hypothetical protein
MTVTTTELYTGLTLTKLLNTILYELGQMVGTTESYNKFTRAFIVRKLNDRQNKFVYHSQCIRKTAFLLCKADYKVYKLPANCMDGGIIGVPKYYTSSTAYANLDIKTKDWLDEKHEGWLTADSSEPMFAYVGDSYGNIPTLGVYPAPDIATGAVRSYRTFSPLPGPRPRQAGGEPGGIFSVALSVSEAYAPACRRSPFDPRC